MSQAPTQRKPRTSRRNPAPTTPSTPGYFASSGPECTDVTVYQQGGVAVVREERSLDLTKGANEVLLQGMPAQYEENSLTVLGFEGNAGDLSLGPISYRAANLDKARILARSVNKPVIATTVLPDGGMFHTAGTLVAVFGNEAAVKEEDGRLFFAPVSQITLPEGIPQGLSATPSLVMAPHAKADGKVKVKLLYETAGLGWSARHSAFYDESSGVLKCFETNVSITNGSGANFSDAKLRLLAGANYSRRGRGGFESAKGGARMAAMSAAPMAMAESVSFDAAGSSQESVGDRKMYTLDEPATIADGETQQITLQRACDVPVKREYFLTYGNYHAAAEDELYKQGVMVRLRMVNDGKHNLGKALPAGDCNIFQFDASGQPQKIATQSLDHIADGEKFKLEFGPSSDIKATRRLVDVKDEEVARPPEPVSDEVPEGGFESPEGGRVRPASAKAAVHRPRNPRDVAAAAPAEKKPPLIFREEERELVLHNYKDTDVEVIVSEFFADNITFVKAPEHTFVKDASGTHSATIAVGAKGKTTVRYRIRYQIGF